MGINLLLLVPAGILLTGCAEVIIQKGGTCRGYDVYRPEPYLLVFTQTTHSETETKGVQDDKQAKAGNNSSGGNNTSGGGGGNDSGAASGGGGGNQPQGGAEGLNGPGITIVWLPNYSERYRIRSSAFFLSKAGANFTIRDGWMLTGVTDQSDNTALLTAAQGVLSSALGAAGSTAKAASKEIGPTAGATGGTITSSNTDTTQSFNLYKLLFDKNGNFYGLADVKPKDKLEDIRGDAKATLAPLRAPTYNGKAP